MIGHVRSRRLGIAATFAALGASSVFLLPAVSAQTARGPRIEVSVAPALASSPLDGRVLIVISRTNDPEPRFQVGPAPTSRPLFGIDVEGWQSGRPVVVDSTVRGYPVEHLDQIPAGDYYVQGVLNVYTTFHRADGHTIKAHMDQWEGQHWNRSPGNLFSDVQRVHIDPQVPTPIAITLTKKIPPMEPAADTPYIKHVRFKSEILSKWWGHDIFLGAMVVLPEGFDAHPARIIRWPTTTITFCRCSRTGRKRRQPQG